MMVDVPFYPQIWDLSRWKELGYESPEDAKYWERSSCGILCLKMAIDTFLLRRGGMPSPSISEHIKKGVAIGAYHDSVGWSHQGLARLAGELGFFAEAKEPARISDLKDALDANTLPIISVRRGFEGAKTVKEKLLFWKKFGGHLALVIGYEEERGAVTGFYVHHTSIYPVYSWSDRFVPLALFRQGFTGRGVIVCERGE